MDLTSLEKIILKDIIDYQKTHNQLDLEGQMESLIVEKREYTGFGIYVHFQIEVQRDLSELVSNRLTCLSSPSGVFVDTLEHQLSFELNIRHNGKFDFLEIVPNGVNSWNGKYNQIDVIKSTANNV